MSNQDLQNDPIRRDFLQSSAAVGALTVSGITANNVFAAKPAQARKPVPSKIELNVNGTVHSLSVDTRTTLLAVLREHLHLTGSKTGYDHGHVAPAPCWWTACAWSAASISRSCTKATRSLPSNSSSTTDLAGYHFAAHADAVNVDALFLPAVDDKSNPLKSKGMSELAICGSGAATANAIYNAWRVRVRSYPIALGKLLLDSKFPT